MLWVQRRLILIYLVNKGEIMSNVIRLDDRRRNSPEFRAAVLRHPCMAARRERKRKFMQNLVACTLILVFCAAMGFVGYVEGL